MGRRADLDNRRGPSGDASGARRGDRLRLLGQEPGPQLRRARCARPRSATRPRRGDSRLPSATTAPSPNSRPCCAIPTSPGWRSPHRPCCMPSWRGSAHRSGQARLRRKAAGIDRGRGRGAVRAGRGPRPAADGRPSDAVPPGLHKAARTGARGRARASAIHLFEPAEPWESAARGGHSVVLRAARSVDDPVARRAGARPRSPRKAAITCTRRSPTSRPRTSPFPAASRRMSSSPGCIRSRNRSWSSSATGRWRCSTTASPGAASCCSIRIASNGAKRCRCRNGPRPTRFRSTKASR